MSKSLSFKVREKGALEPLHLPRGMIKSTGSDGSARSTASSTSPRQEISPSSSTMKLINSPRRSPKPSTPSTILKANTDPLKRFSGTWESNDVDGLDAMAAELGLSTKFKRLSDRFASLSSILAIEQDGDLFSIEDSNEMREVLVAFIVGTPFESESEKGEEVISNVTWDGPVLSHVSTPKAGGGNIVVVRRWFVVVSSFVLLLPRCFLLIDWRKVRRLILFFKNNRAGLKMTVSSKRLKWSDRKAFLNEYTEELSEKKIWSFADADYSMLLWEVTHV